jgi:hypothetical protein
MRGRHLRALAGLGCLCAVAVQAAEPAAPSWNEVDRLASEQKHEAASAELTRLRVAAQKAGDEEGWARALVREAQLRSGLDGFETAVRFLRDQPWPKGALPRAALLLYRAWTYVQYADAYSYEIGQRERVASAESVDLKSWTLEQIFAAATADYVEVWKGRAALGAAPISRLGEFLVANDYPPEVRGTLRDAVSYLFVELLSNPQGWRPEQLNEVGALDVPALVEGDPARSRQVPLGDPAVHPLVKIGALLDDLEAWHLERRERDAALEARLARTRALSPHFTDAADRDAIIQSLARRLGAFADRPWWAMGQGTLAGLVQERGDLPRALKLARAGAAAYPGSPGAKLCQSIAAGIEAPAYSLDSMTTDGLGRRSLRVEHKNLTALTLRAYPIDLDRFLHRTGRYRLIPDADDMKALLARKPAVEWTVALPATPDFESHQTFVTPPLDKLGLYAIVASARKDFARAGNQLAGVPFVATDIVMIDRRDSSGALEAEVVDGASGAPVAGAEVVVYRYAYNKVPPVDRTAKTDARGVVRFAAPPAGNPERFMVARRGRSYALDPRIVYFERDRAPREATDALVYTDRSIYRPLQKLQFKAIVYRGAAAAARFHVLPNHAVTVSLLDANGEEVAKRPLKTNAWGSVSGVFDIPAGRLLGRWSVATNAGGSASVRVEEYKRPTFEVKLVDPKSPYRLGRPAAVEGEARYYFGLPVAAGEVRWRVTREPVLPPWSDWLWGLFEPRDRSGVQTVATGRAALDGAGHFRFTFTPATPPARAGRRAPAPTRAPRARCRTATRWSPT